MKWKLKFENSNITQVHYDEIVLALWMILLNFFRARGTFLNRLLEVDIFNKLWVQYAQLEVAGSSTTYDESV